MRLRILEQAMSVLAPTTKGKGLCFHWSAAMVLELRGSELVIGVLHDNLIHAWVEYQDRVYAPTLIERFDGLAPINRDYYYGVNRVRDTKRLSRRQVIGIGAHRHLTTGEPLSGGRALGDELMRLAGIEWRSSAEGTAIAMRQRL